MKQQSILIPAKPGRNGIPWPVTAFFGMFGITFLAVGIGGVLHLIKFVPNRDSPPLALVIVGGLIVLIVYLVLSWRRQIEVRSEPRIIVSRRGFKPFIRCRTYSLDDFAALRITRQARSAGKAGGTYLVYHLHLAKSDNAIGPRICTLGDLGRGDNLTSLAQIRNEAAMLTQFVNLPVIDAVPVAPRPLDPREAQRILQEQPSTGDQIPTVPARTPRSVRLRRSTHAWTALMLVLFLFPPAFAGWKWYDYWRLHSGWSTTTARTLSTATNDQGHAVYYEFEVDGRKYRQWHRWVDSTTFVAARSRQPIPVSYLSRDASISQPGPAPSGFPFPWTVGDVVQSFVKGVPYFFILVPAVFIRWRRIARAVRLARYGTLIPAVIDWSLNQREKPGVKFSFNRSVVLDTSVNTDDPPFHYTNNGVAGTARSRVAMYVGRYGIALKLPQLSRQWALQDPQKPTDVALVEMLKDYVAF